MFSCATRADQKTSLEDLMAWLRRKKTKDGIMVWIHLLSHKKSEQDSMHFMVARQQQRLSDAMKSSRWPGFPSQPAYRHATPRTQCWRWGRGGGRTKGRRSGYWRPYRGFWPVNMRNPSYSRAGRVWLTVVQYWLVKGLDRRLTLGRLKACSKGLVLNVMFMQYSVERNTGIQHTRAF